MKHKQIFIHIALAILFLIVLPTASSFLYVKILQIKPYWLSILISCFQGGISGAIWVTVDKKIRNYFINKDIQFIREYQKCNWVHPLTCGINSNHKELEPIAMSNSVILVCPDCGYTQYSIPECVYKVNISNDPLNRLKKDNKISTSYSIFM